MFHRPRRPPLSTLRHRWGGTLVGASLAAVVCATPAPAVIPAPGYYGFQYATGLHSPATMAFGPDGTLYVGEVAGRVYALRDTTGDHVVDVTTLYRSGITSVLGMEWRNGGLFVSVAGKIIKLLDTNGDFVADVVDTVIASIPNGLHRNNGITFGPDGLLYVTNGSQSENAAGDPWSAAILRFTESGDFVDVFATGFRNPYDLAFYAPKNKLYSSDNTQSGDETFPCYEGPDEINLITQGGFYGFPGCFGAGDCIDVGCDPPPCGPGSCSRGAGCVGTTLPALLLLPHTAPTGMCFGSGAPGFDTRDLFFAEFGPFLTTSCFTDFGHDVRRVRLNPGGNISGGTEPEVFLTDIARPTDVVFGPDSALYVCDYAYGDVYRIFKIQASTGVPDGMSPTPSRLWASPNPAVTHTQFYWEDAPPGEVRYEIFDLTGRRVNAFSTSDANPRGWRLTDGAGRRVPGGVYVVRASSGARSVSVKVVVTE